MNMIKGFTLIELMVVMVVVVIMAAIAVPSYGAYVRKNHEKLTVQKIGELAQMLEKEKTRNFSYKGFSPKEFEITKNSSSSEVIYTISVEPEDRTWVIAGCVNTTLSNAALYKNFAQNSKGASCEWSDMSCTVPDECK